MNLANRKLKQFKLHRDVLKMIVQIPTYLADQTGLVWIVVKILVLLPYYLVTSSVVVGSPIIPEYFLTYSS